MNNNFLFFSLYRFSGAGGGGGGRIWGMSHSLPSGMV